MTTDLAEIERTARALIAKHAPEGWTFQWTTQKEAYGVTRHHNKTIGISKPNAAHQSYEQTIDTIMHEIAHAVAGPGKGHGPVWKRIATQLGAEPHSHARETAEVPLRQATAPWVGTCPSGHVSRYRFYRKPTRRYSCSECSKTWSEAYLLTYTKEES